MSVANYSLDTSVVIRLLTGQPVAQFNTAMKFLSGARAKAATIHVEDLVLAEAYYALQAYYEIPKDKALAALATFADATGTTLSEVAQYVLSTPDLDTAKPGFVDRLIHGQCSTRNHTLVTFEKAARKLPRTQILKTERTEK